MPTLIALTDETRGDVPAEVTHLVEEPIVEGDPEPEFLFATSGKWRRNAWRGLPLPRGTSIKSFARRATQSEIEATRAEASPFVGRDELVEVLRTALEFYADKGNWYVEGVSVNAQELFDTPMADDLGKRARAALAAAGKGE